MFAICEITNINVDFKIFAIASHSAFSKNTKIQTKLKPKHYLKITDTLCRECYNLDMCQNSDKNINV